MAIAFDAASNSGYQAASGSYSWSHTTAGGDRYLVVAVAMLSVVGSSVTGITYGGVAMSLLRAKSSAIGAIRVEVWGLKAPALGANTIAVSLSSSLISAASASSYAGVHQAAGIDADSTNDGSATNVGAADATVTVRTYIDGELPVAAVATDDATIVIGSGQNSRANVTGVAGSGVLGDRDAVTPVAINTMNWSNVAALATWSIVGIALRPAASIVPSVSRAGIGSIRGGL